MPDLEMFLRGSYVYCKLPIIALAFFTLLIASAEFFFQKTDIGFVPVLGANLLFYASVWVQLFIIEFIAECMGGDLDGDLSAITILLVLFTIISSTLKNIANKAIDIHFVYEWVFIVLPVLLVLIPVIIFVLYIRALALSWTSWN